jgi:nucleoside-diphosphate-sugar epimerase
LEAPRSVIHNQVFNVGSNSENYQVRQIAEIVAGAFLGCELSFGKSDGDNRSYRVCFDKIHSLLPGFKCRYNVRDGAFELYELFQTIDMTCDVFDFRAYTRLKQLEYLLRTGQIDDHFYWIKSTDSHAVSETSCQLGVKRALATG